MNGRSQAVRIPKEFRLPGAEVSIRKVGDSLLIEPISGANGWPTDYLDSIHIEDEAFERLPQGDVPSIPDLEA